ncbi:MAG: hypothetical protein IJ262_00405 [Clostridia bacterium]|nr:hypothetical protein [Clostridia bacterium]
MKKFLALVLTVVMLLSATVIPSSAVSLSGKLESKLETVVESLLGTLIGNGEKTDVDVDGAFIEALKEEMSYIGYNPLAKELSGYAVVQYGAVEDVEAVAESIAENTSYRAYVTDNGKTSVYIVIDLEENPELFDSEVFRAAVVKIVDKQGEVIEEDAENLDLMDYNRFAGELYLHMLLFQVTAPFKDIDWIPLVSDIYNTASGAEMDVTESRFPSSLLVVIGFVVLEIFGRLGM